MKHRNFEFSLIGNVVKLLNKAIPIILLLIVWEVASTKVSSLFVPSPQSVLISGYEYFITGRLWKATCYSFYRITTSTLLSIAIAYPIGLIMYNYKVVKNALSPFVSAMRYVPITAFYPLLIMWFGINEKMKIAFLFIATFLYMMPSVILCLDEIEDNLIDTGLTIGMSKIQTIVYIQIPATLPSILNSFIMMFGIGFTYISVAETINAKYGLGFIIQQSSARGRTDLVFMAIIVIMIISVIFDTISKWIVKKLFAWKYLES